MKHRYLLPLATVLAFWVMRACGISQTGYELWFLLLDVPITLFYFSIFTS